MLDLEEQKFGVACIGSPIFPIAVNICLEELEQELIDTAPENCQPRSWMRCGDGAICLVCTGKADKHSRPRE